MRRILQFKFWHIKSGSWLQERIKLSNRAGSFGFSFSSDIEYDSLDIIAVASTDEVDRNGRIIFEFDILRWDHPKPEPVFDGYYDETRPANVEVVRWINFEQVGASTGWRMQSNSKMGGDCEIIGNVFDNPELIPRNNVSRKAPLSLQFIAINKWEKFQEEIKEKRQLNCMARCDWDKVFEATK